MDFERLKSDLFKDSKSVDEQVTVNQRHLIDKILARYSAENTIFRELLQNSNDAGASRVKITFNTPKNQKQSPSLPGTWLPWASTVKTCESIIYSNDGAPFNSEDWNRLRKIAEGNPDEQKIGFFGVGFYSLFSICEEPLVTSLNESMAFYWKNDMLFTKRGTLPNESVSEWTTFYLQTREAMPLPDKYEFGKFIATSMAFASKIKQVEVFVDQERILHFNRRGGDPKPIQDISRFSLASPQRMFSLTSIGISQIQLDLNMANNCNYTVFMRVVEAELKVSIPRKLMEEMIRTTKKSAPNTTKMLILLSNFEEYDSTMQTTKGSKDLFQNLIPMPERQGNVYIGFPTHQTTGSSISLAGHFIPTVERESIDFADKSLAVWNMELLSMAGLMSRISFENEVDSISILLDQMELDSTSRDWFYKKVAFNMNIFFQKPSTPSHLVGKMIEMNFNSCSKSPLRLLGSNGKLVPVEMLRQEPSTEIKSFIKNTLFLAQDFEKHCLDVIASLKRSGKLREISLDDVFVEFSNRPLQKEEMKNFIKYWISQVHQGKITRGDMEKLKSCLLFQNDGGQIIPMHTINLFSSQKLVPKELPLPETCMDIDTTRGIDVNELRSCFWGWTELKAIDWIKFIVKTTSFQKEEAFTENVVGTIGRLYKSLSQQDKATTVFELQKTKCLLTSNKGLEFPRNCYLSNVTLFNDLPKVSNSHTSELFLKDLGVREHVELQLVFDRLNDLSWDQVQLIKYLGSIEEKLKPSEVSALTNTALFFKEGDDTTRYKACQLFTPVDKFRSFGLDLLAFDKNKWKYTSKEASLMKKLGLNSTIPIDLFLKLIAQCKSNAERLLFFKYFDGEPEYEKTYSAEKITTEFIPSLAATGGKLCRPLGVYSDENAALLNFHVIDPLFKAFSRKLGVQETPNGDLLVERLKASPPRTTEEAEKVFSFLSQLNGKFSNINWSMLAKTKFIPVIENDTLVHHSPLTVYVMSEQRISHFVYISYGPAATAFLRACGVKDQPSPKELAYSLAKNPEAFLEKSSPETYLSMLRQIGASYQQIRQDYSLLALMKNSAFLLAFQQAQNGGAEKTFSLALANDIYLVDDPILQQVFKPLTAPIEQPLETMYQDLGSTWLSSQVQETYSPSGEYRVSLASSELEKTIRDRSPLLLYDGHQIRVKSDLNSFDLSKLRVFEIGKIDIVRRFKTVTNSQVTTSCIAQLTTMPNALFVTSNFDYYDVASSIAKLFIKKPRLNDSLLISTFLSSTLDNLNRKGFPVDRILSVTAPPPQVPLTFQKNNTSSNTVANHIDNPPSSSSRLNKGKEKMMNDENRKPSTDIFQNMFNQFGEFGKAMGIDLANDKPKEQVPKDPYNVEQLKSSVDRVKSTRDDRVVADFNESNQVRRPPRYSIQSCTPLTDLVYQQKLSRNLEFFMAKDCKELPNLAMESLSTFANVVELLQTRVFRIKTSVNIYYDLDGQVVAFNRSGELFFNLRYYVGWNQNFKDAIYNWYFIFCHELAHNEHGPHDEVHEHYLVSFAHLYLENLFALGKEF